MEKESESKSWNYQNIVASILFLLALGGIGYWQRDLILSYNTMPTKEVAGSHIRQNNDETKVAVPKIDLQEKITAIADQVSKLDVKEVTASSPQVQKVLKDMEALKDLPKNEAKNACMSICSSL